MTTHPAKGCTKRQIEAFEAICVNQEPFAGQKTIDALLRRGLIERGPDKALGRDCLGIIQVPQYAVPLSVHHQWCEWCSENFGEDE